MKKILEICPYSSGACGVWQRVKQESMELVKKGYEVKVFSSYFEKGTDKILPEKDNLNGISINRFPAKKLGGESFMNWDFEKEAINYSPDIIIAHNYRHLHTTKSINVAEELRSRGKQVKLFLVTHAPFVEGNITRSKFSTLIVNLYDRLIGPRILKRFDKILTIAHWEIPYLMKAGAPEENIVYIPNGIPIEFFILKNQSKDENKILFLSRISPKKKVDTLISAIPFIDKSVKIEIVGPKEEPYFTKIKSMINELNVLDRVIISEPIYNIKEKIKKIDSAKVFVLPSRVEGMPQALIEAMSRGKIVIGSDSIAIRDLIKDKKNGYLFEFDNPKDLAEKINQAIKNNNTNKVIKRQAKLSVIDFAWNKVIQKIESLF